MRSLLKIGLAVCLIATSFTKVVSAEFFGPAAIANPANDIKVEASTSGLRITVLNDDNDGSSIPSVFYTLDSINFAPVAYIFSNWLGGGFFLDHYLLSKNLDCGTNGKIRVIDGASNVFADFSVPCSSLGSIRGTAYKDGAKFAGAWYKITDGGNWYTCGTVGDDGTFGVPAEPGTYYLIPLNLQGLKASGIKKVVVEGGKASLGNDITYTSDPSARHEPCDLYNPPRPIPSNVR